MAYLELLGISKNFSSIRALEDITFSVSKGEVLGFLGPNGAGKSTAMKIITGCVPATRGVVKVFGTPLTKGRLKSKHAMGYLPEGSPVYGEMTPSVFLSFIGKARRMAKEQYKRRLNYVVEKLSLWSVMHRPIETLSKGYRRRVGIAQAILHDPPILILDEPTDGLDPNQRTQVFELIKSIAPQKAVIISTHILEEVEAICTRGLLLNAGKIVKDVPQKEVNRQSLQHLFASFTTPDVQQDRTNASSSSRKAFKRKEASQHEKEGPPSNHQ